MKTIKLFLGILLVSLITTPALAKLEDNSNSFKPKLDLERIKEEGRGLLEQNKEQRCEQIASRIDSKVTAFNANKDAKEQVYANIKERINTIVTKFKEKGYDTSVLEGDLVILNEKITKYWTDRQAVITKLEEAKTFVCGESDGAFKQKIQEAKELMKVVLADAKDIRSFITTVIREDIGQIKAQKRDSKTPTTLEVED